MPTADLIQEGGPAPSLGGLNAPWRLARRWGPPEPHRGLDAERWTDEIGSEGQTTGTTLRAETAGRCYSHPVTPDRRWHVSFKDTSVYFFPSASNTLMAQVSCFRRQR